MKTAVLALAAVVASSAFGVLDAIETPTTRTAALVASHESSLAESAFVDGAPAPPAAQTFLAESILVLKRAEGASLPVFPGYEQTWHQANDAMIARVVEDFNRQMGWGASHPHHLDAALVKAWALQESGGHQGIFTSGDMMQMNNNGDWADEKRWFGVERGERLSPEESLRAALRWAYYKGEETRPMPQGVAEAGWYPTVRGGEILPRYESRFTGWKIALTRYNGGGVADYHGDIARKLAKIGRHA